MHFRGVIDQKVQAVLALALSRINKVCKRIGAKAAPINAKVSQYLTTEKSVRIPLNHLFLSLGLAVDGLVVVRKARF